MRSELKVVLFTDQVGSTSSTAVRTPAEIRRVDRDQRELTEDVARQCRGTILKDTGDGALVEFVSCADAVRCGFLLQERVRVRNETQANPGLRFELHVGIEFGEVVVLADGDLRGDAANVAARVCAQCPPGEVYFTAKVMRELHRREVQVERVGAVSLKGVSGDVEIYRLVEWIGVIEGARNPFVWRKGITEAGAFFGREREQSTLRTYIASRQNCQAIGPRRIGKTSLLRQVQRVIPTWDETAIVAYIDCQDARCFTLAGWLAFVSRHLKFGAPASGLAEFAEALEATLSHGHRLVLCLDEFEELTARPAEFGPPFFSALRACSQQGMSIVAAAHRPLSELTDPGDPTSPFYNTFPILRMAPFPDADAHDFLALRRPGTMPFTDEERGAILAFAKGHPLALQLGAFHVVEARAAGESVATAIENALHDVRAHQPTW